MKRALILALLAAVAYCSDSDQYTDRYDDLNIDEILANRRLLTPYLNCVLDKGRCTPEGKELKVHIKDAMQSACSKCTEKQKQAARRVVNHIKEKESEFWELMKAKYDPGDKYKEVYEGFLAAQE